MIKSDKQARQFSYGINKRVAERVLGPDHELTKLAEKVKRHNSPKLFREYLHGVDELPEWQRHQLVAAIEQDPT